MVPPLGRRKALGLLATTALPACGSPPPASPPEPFEVAPVGEFTAPVWRFYFQREVVVARDARGLFAMTAVCTHQRCLVRPREVPGLCMPPVEDATNSTGELCCHCHGSVYDGQGVPLTGPATRPLTHFRVSVVDGRVRVHPAEPVPADARTVV